MDVVGEEVGVLHVLEVGDGEPVHHVLVLVWPGGVSVDLGWVGQQPYMAYTLLSLECSSQSQGKDSLRMMQLHALLWSGRWLSGQKNSFPI